MDVIFIGIYGKQFVHYRLIVAFWMVFSFIFIIIVISDFWFEYSNMLFYIKIFILYIIIRMLRHYFMS